jgi:hypothetical protein
MFNTIPYMSLSLLVITEHFLGCAEMTDTVSDSAIH